MERKNKKKIVEILILQIQKILLEKIWKMIFKDMLTPNPTSTIQQLSSI